MNKKKLKKLFDLCGELYQEEQNKSGMIPAMPYCYAQNSKTGELVIFSAFGSDSRKIKDTAY